MNDDEVIARLRGALDEVTSSAGARDEIAELEPRRSRRALAAAAAVALVALVLAGVALATRRSGPARTRSASPSSVTSAAPATTAVPAVASTVPGAGELPGITAATVPVGPGVGSVEPPATIPPRFTLPVAGLVERPSTQSTASEAADNTWMTAWQYSTTLGSSAPGWLIVTASHPAVPPAPTKLYPPGDPAGSFSEPRAEGDGWLQRGEYTVVRPDGWVWAFVFQGLATADFLRIVGEAQPGSGLPVVIPDAGLQMVTTGSISGAAFGQSWSDGDAAANIGLTLTADPSALRSLAGAIAVEAHTVVGRAGWRVLAQNGDVHAVWSDDHGWWGDLQIPAARSSQADVIIAALTRDDGTTLTTVTLPATSTTSSTTTTSTLVPITVPATTGESSVPTGSFRATAGFIQEAGGPPMLAFSFKDSAPPQGGDVPLVGFDWWMVNDVQQMNGVTWVERSYDVVGTWDGTTFTLTQPPVEHTFTLPTTAPGSPTPGCITAAAEQLSAAVGTWDVKALRLQSWRPDTTYGHCGVSIVAIADSPALRAAVATLGAGADVVLQFLIVPVSGGTG